MSEKVDMRTGEILEIGPLGGRLSSKEAGPAFAKRMSEAVLEIQERLPLDGYNDYHDYHYTTATSIFEISRKALAFHDIWPVPAVKKTERKGNVTFIDADITLFFPEGWLTIPWSAEATDKGDKGTGKAFTALNKTFLKALLQLPTGDESDDIDAHDGTREPQPRREPTRKRTSSGNGGGSKAKGHSWPGETMAAIRSTGIVEPWNAKHAINALNLSEQIGPGDAADVVVKWVQLYAEARGEELTPNDAATMADQHIKADVDVSRWVGEHSGDGKEEAEPEDESE